MLDTPENSATRISLCPRGLRLGDTEVPLISGSVHYFRLDPREWLASLTALQSLGIEIVDVYLPWGVHEQVDGSFDFGTKDPRLDVVRFLKQAKDLGMLAIVRPGTAHQCRAHLLRHPGTRGLEQPIARRARRAASRSCCPVPPLAFPVPSYASEAFLRGVRSLARERWVSNWPRWSGRHGPIVLCQIDNEGALYFRDGVYDQDHHPDAVATYRAFLLRKYGSIEAIREVLPRPRRRPRRRSCHPRDYPANPCWIWRVTWTPPKLKKRSSRAPFCA